MTVVDAGTVTNVRPGFGIREGYNTLYIVPAGTTGSDIVLGKDGGKIKIGIKNNGKVTPSELNVSPNVKVYRYRYGRKTDLTPGASVYIRIPKEDLQFGSTLKLGDVTEVAVGRNGVMPTMFLPRPTPPKGAPK